MNSLTTGSTHCFNLRSKNIFKKFVVQFVNICLIAALTSTPSIGFCSIGLKVNIDINTGITSIRNRVSCDSNNKIFETFIFQNSHRLSNFHKYYGNHFQQRISNQYLPYRTSTWYWLTLKIKYQQISFSKYSTFFL